MKRGAFWAFAAVFAVAVGWLFAGAWSADLAPVMPDCAVSFPRRWLAARGGEWLANGKFVPDDLLVLLGGPYVWQELRYAVALFAAALGLAWFLRGRGLSRLSAYGAGLFLAFSGYWCTLFSAGHLGWFRWMTYGVWVFGLVDRALGRGGARYWLLLGACLAWGSFYQPDLWLLFTLFSFVYFLYRLYRERARFLPLRAGGIRFLKGAALACAAFVLIGLPSFRSAFVNDLGGRDAQIASSAANPADEARARWIFVTNWSLPPEDTLELVVPRVQGDTSCPLTLAINGAAKGTRPYTGRLGRPDGAPGGNYRQHALYAGAATCALALWALVAACGRGGLRACALSRADIFFFAACAFVFWLFALGRYCAPVYRLVYALPFGDYLRAPVKWLHLTEFALAVLAGYGLEALRRLLARTSLAPSMQTAALVLLILIGTFDLVRVDALYCAPRRADAQLQFADIQALRNPSVQDQMRRARMRVLGYYGAAALVEVPQPRENGPADVPAPVPGVLVWAILSVLADLLLAGWLVGDFLLRKRKTEQK